MQHARRKSDNGSQKEIVGNQSITCFVNNKYEGWANENTIVCHLTFF